jgi:hypothetical protein
MSVNDSLKAATSLMAMSIPEVQIVEKASSSSDESGLFSSMKAITSLVSMSKDNEQPVESWTKTTITKFQTTSLSDQQELQRLNIQLKNYLENVRVLEALNKTLISEVEKARVRAMPQLMDKSKLDESLESVRIKLEDDSTDCVIHQARIDECQGLINHINTRLKFYHNEGEIQKQRLVALHNQLAEIKNSREYIVRSAELANDNIARERARIFQAEKDLEVLRAKMRASKSKNKQIEFEMQTLLDELEFRKAIFNQEKVEILAKQQNGRVLEGVDLSNFYRNELVTAVRQIREDFHNLSNHQLAQYKELKEAELKFQMHQAQQEKINMENARAKMESKVSLELQSASELRAYSEQFGPTMSALKSENSALAQRLQALENALHEMKSRQRDALERKVYEIEQLRGQNEFYTTELAHWDTVHRTKLETEIQTYRSILNSQIKLMKSDSYYTYEVVKSEPNVSNVITESAVIRHRSPSPVKVITREIVYRDPTPPPTPKVVTREIVYRDPTPPPVTKVVTREIRTETVKTPSSSVNLIINSNKGSGETRDQKTSSSKVFDTQIKQDSKQQKVEQDRTVYEVKEIGDKKKYETVEIIRGGDHDGRRVEYVETVVERKPRYNYVDVIRRYDTGDSERNKIING